MGQVFGHGSNGIEWISDLFPRIYHKCGQILKNVGIL